MTALVAAGQRVLPRGWRDFGRQIAIWFGFLVAYQLARGLADRDPAQAFRNGIKVIGIERNANALFELTIQRLTDSSGILRVAASTPIVLAPSPVFTVCTMAYLPGAVSPATKSWAPAVLANA